MALPKETNQLPLATTAESFEATEHGTRTTTNNNGINNGLSGGLLSNNDVGTLLSTKEQTGHGPEATTTTNNIITTTETELINNMGLGGIGTRETPREPQPGLSDADVRAGCSNPPVAVLKRTTAPPTPLTQSNNTETAGTGGLLSNNNGGLSYGQLLANSHGNGTLAGVRGFPDENGSKASGVGTGGLGISEYGQERVDNNENMCESDKLNKTCLNNKNNAKLDSLRQIHYESTQEVLNLNKLKSSVIEMEYQSVLFRINKEIKLLSTPLTIAEMQAELLARNVEFRKHQLKAYYQELFAKSVNDNINKLSARIENMHELMNKETQQSNPAIIDLAESESIESDFVSVAEVEKAAENNQSKLGAQLNEGLMVSNISSTNNPIIDDEEKAECITKSDGFTRTEMIELMNNAQSKFMANLKPIIRSVIEESIDKKESVARNNKMGQQQLNVDAAIFEPIQRNASVRDNSHHQHSLEPNYLVTPKPYQAATTSYEFNSNGYGDSIAELSIEYGFEQPTSRDQELFISNSDRMSTTSETPFIARQKTVFTASLFKMTDTFEDSAVTQKVRLNKEAFELSPVLSRRGPGVIKVLQKWRLHFGVYPSISEKERIRICVTKGCEGNIRDELLYWLNVNSDKNISMNDLCVKIIVTYCGKIDIDGLQANVMKWKILGSSTPNEIADSFEAWIRFPIFQINSYNYAMVKISGSLIPQLNENALIRHFRKQLAEIQPAIAFQLEQKIVQARVSFVKWYKILMYMNEIDHSLNPLGGISLSSELKVVNNGGNYAKPDYQNNYRGRGRDRSRGRDSHRNYANGDQNANYYQGQQSRRGPYRGRGRERGRGRGRGGQRNNGYNYRNNHYNRDGNKGDKSKIACYYYLKGNCWKGNDCEYSHDLKPAPTNNAAICAVRPEIDQPQAPADPQANEVNRVQSAPEYRPRHY